MNRITVPVGSFLVFELEDAKLFSLSKTEEKAAIQILPPPPKSAMPKQQGVPQPPLTDQNQIRLLSANRDQAMDDELRRLSQEESGPVHSGAVSNTNIVLQSGDTLIGKRRDGTPVYGRRRRRVNRILA